MAKTKIEKPDSAENPDCPDCSATMAWQHCKCCAEGGHWACGCDKKTIYAINSELQKDLVDKHCFGHCGKIQTGGLNINGTACVPCMEIDCPHEEENIRWNDEVVLRRLKA